MVLTARDEDILSVLTLRVRALALRQVERTWWGEGDAAERAARRRVGMLEEGGWVQTATVLAQPLKDISGPLLAWAPPSPAPELASLAYTLRNRWRGPAGPVRVVRASGAACRRFGAPNPRPSRRSETNHDLALAGVYLRLRSTDPGRASQWVTEARLLELGWARDDRLPDAMICSEDGFLAIEFAGTYRKEKLESFHAFCAERSLAYELW